MKILCVSDQIDPFVYNTTAKERFADIDLVLCAGDLPMDYIDFVVSTLNKPTYFIFGNHNLNEFNYYHHQRNVPFQSATDSALLNIASSGCHGAEYAGFKIFTDWRFVRTDPVTNKRTPLIIAGASGSLKYNNGLDQYTDSQMKSKLQSMTLKLFINKIRYGRYLDIFLTHATPRHIHDHEDNCHKGFECYNWFIQKYKPAYMVHGHIHLYDMREVRSSLSGETTVLNAFGYSIIDMPEFIPAVSKY